MQANEVAAQSPSANLLARHPSLVTRHSSPGSVLAVFVRFLTLLPLRTDATMAACRFARYALSPFLVVRVWT
jgi:hypothetical protein